MFQLWFLIWVRIVILTGFGCYFHASWDICKVRKCGFLNGLGSTWEDTSSPCHNRIKIVSESYQNRIKTILKYIKIISKPQKPSRNRPNTCRWLFRFALLKPIHRNHIKIKSESYQNRTKSYQIVSTAYQNVLVSKQYQTHIKNHIKTTKTIEKSTKHLSLAVSVSLFEANPLGTLKKALRSQTISKHHKPPLKPYLYKP